MQNLEAEITNHVTAFVDDLGQLARRAAMEALSATLGALGVAKPAPSTPARPAAVPQARKAGGKRIRRDAGGLSQIKARLAECIAANPGQGMEAITKALGLATKDVALPVRKLIADGVLRTEGQRRGTRYFAVASLKAAVASKPRGRGKAK